MNIQSIILLIVIIAAFVAAIIYMVKNKGPMGCGGKSTGCNGDCSNCTRMHKK